MVKWLRGGIFLAAACMVFGCFGCAPAETESLPEDTIEEFEDAVNAMDVNAMLDCLDENAQDTIGAGLELIVGLAGAVAGVDLDIKAEDLFALMPFFQVLQMEAEGDYEFEPQVELQVTKTLIRKNKATAFVTELYSGENLIMNMEREDGKWYITFSTVMVSEEDADRVLIPGQEEAPKEEKEQKEGALSEYLDTEKLKADIIDFLESALKETQ